MRASGGGAMQRILTSTVSALAVAAAGLAAPAMAGEITGWNLNNVVVSISNDPVPGAGASLVYDRRVTGGTAGARTNGRITFEPPESVSPGLQVLNDSPNLNPGRNIPDCIAATGVGSCEAAFQSGKRFKMDATDVGPIDLVFDTQTTIGANSYQVFQKLLNDTPALLSGFTVQLGTGIGDAFVRSTAGDGLGFDPSVELGPNDLPAFSQFAFGLFGDASENPNFSLDGFFASQRAGFDLAFSEDQLTSGALSPVYAGLFGPAMLNGDAVPLGYFWDNDGNPDTDAILMAWQKPDGTWEQRRGIADLALGLVESITPITVTEDALLGLGFLGGEIEDLRNLNLNYNILVGDFAGDSFTLRFTPVEAAVPTPAALPLFAVGLGMLGLGLRRRRG
jgi:hypothetical protein